MTDRFRKLAALALVAALLPGAASANVCASTYRNGSRDEPRVAVTVDDAADMQALKDILDLCDRYDAKITVFPVGKILRTEDREVWRRVVDSGDEIGNHSYTHRYLMYLKPRQVHSDLARFEKRLDEVLGYDYKPRVARPPYGALGDGRGASFVGRQMFGLGYHCAILWDVSNTDPEKALKETKNGSILLFHAKPKDYACLQTLIPALIAKGYELVTVSELLYIDDQGDAHVPEPTAEPL